MPRDVDTPWYTREEAAQYLRMSVDTLDRWERDRTLVRRSAANGRVRYHKEDLDNAFAVHVVEEKPTLENLTLAEFKELWD